jgi:hypothetical protein
MSQQLHTLQQQCLAGRFLNQVPLYVFLAVHVDVPIETRLELELKATCRNYNLLAVAVKYTNLELKLNT